jgi:hypothetical protein
LVRQSFGLCLINRRQLSQELGAISFLVPNVLSIVEVGRSPLTLQVFECSLQGGVGPQTRFRTVHITILSLPCLCISPLPQGLTVMRSPKARCRLNHSPLCVRMTGEER